MSYIIQRKIIVLTVYVVSKVCHTSSSGSVFHTSRETSSYENIARLRLISHHISVILTVSRRCLKVAGKYALHPGTLPADGQIPRKICVFADRAHLCRELSLILTQEHSKRSPHQLDTARVLADRHKPNPNLGAGLRNVVVGSHSI
jgi:hypothetical protein